MPSVLRRLSSALAFPALLLFAAAPVSAETVTVRITSRLEPAEVTVPAGTTIRWVNASAERHRMRSQRGPLEFDSGNLEPGESFSVRLTSAGTHEYLDERDDDDARYFGRIVVTKAGSAPTAEQASGGGGTGNGGVPTASLAESVGMAGRTFGPSIVTIAAGGSVTWRNDDDRAHTVTSTDGAFDSGTMGEGATFERPFTSAGSFSYLCAIHPEMTGTVVVTSGSGAAPPISAATPRPPPTRTPAPVSSTPPIDAGSAGPLTATVDIADFSFGPTSLTVAPGATVTWRNGGTTPHTVTAEDGAFDSDLIAAGASFTREFPALGRFAYVCAFHPEMTGAVDVVGAGTGEGPSPQPQRSDPPVRGGPSASHDPSSGAAAARGGPAASPRTDRGVPVGGRTDGELFARVGIVTVLVGGAVVLFARAVGGVSNRREMRAD